MAEKNVLESVLSPEQAAICRGRLLPLLAAQTARYTAGDSSSVPVETARELLQSLVFTLEQGLTQRGLPQTALLTEDLEKLRKTGVAALGERVEDARRLWERACATAPGISSISYRDTLRGVGLFFKKYDCRYFAHQIPCDIDYQLCRPVSERLQGVEYVIEYLKRMVWENAFLGLFRPEDTERLLSASSPDWKGLLVNQCEPVFINALGRVLLGKNPGGLEVLDEDRQELYRLLEPMSAGKAGAALAEASAALCSRLGINEPGARSYFESVASDLLPRLMSAVKTGGLGGVFLSF